MKELVELTEEFANHIVKIENQRKEISEFLRKTNSTSEEK